ncbi:MAG: prepilin-type N-terminal cleavage/methylation domain-containing protein [Planctomycetes bacterium]|nr:prepilin-type N-terminal cleavage/methylation domain-containing protein [Planctomycetota bacterium]
MCLHRSLHNSRRRWGFTLIEVLAGLAILGTVMAGAMIAKARCTRQLAQADRRLAAAAAADRMLEYWFADDKTLPRESSGNVPGESDMTWRTHTQRDESNRILKLAITRLEVFDGRAIRPDEAILSVELLVPALQTKGKS